MALPSKPLLKRTGVLFLLGYLLLLAASHLWQGRADDSSAVPQGDEKTVRLKPVTGDTLHPGREVPLTYRDSGPEERPVIVLLHDALPEAGDLEQLVSLLDRRFRVVMPRMPGYGSPDAAIPDYSLQARATYVAQLLDSLEIETAHLAGFRQGGGVGINLAHRYPNRVRSMILLSSIGVQELELMGSHSLNRAAHALQLGAVWMVRVAVPHFGLLGDGIPDRAYARSFYDSDQRPIRGYLREYEKPLLLQHGMEDGLVPAVVAQEHYRIVPQSELLLYEGDQALVEEYAPAVAEDIASFVTRVENGEAATLSDAEPSRLNAARESFEKIRFSPFEGLNLLVLMLVIVAATFLSEDLACIGAGLLVARGLIAFLPATAACFAGIVIGDMTCYLLGRWAGRPALRYAPLRWFISESDIERSAEWFAAKGPAIIVASRFLPGSRFPTYFSAGVMGAGFWMFSFYFMMAAVVWTPMLVGLSMAVGNSLIEYFTLYRHYALWVIAGVILLLFLLIRYVIPALGGRGIPDGTGRVDE